MPEISYSQGMPRYMYEHGIKIFDYPKFAEPFKEAIRANAERIAKEHGVEIEFIRKAGVRKESIISEKIEKRGNHPGIVHIISAMESCSTYKPWHDKTTGKTFLKPDTGKCLHYYFYFIDEQVGLCYVRVPAWAPFRLQVYLNGHNLLASELKNAGIKYSMTDNAFDSLEDAGKAQELSDKISIEKLHRKLDEFAWRFCPVYKDFNLRYHWSVMQAEYATDIVFKKQEGLQQIYSALVATAIHTVKPENIATFLGHKLDGRYKEVGRERLEKITSSKSENNRNYKGFNFFSADDLTILMAIVRGEFNINGFRNKNMQKLLGFNGGKISRLIKRLRVHGLIKKAADSYKYYLTKIGKETIIMAQKIKEPVLVPAYCY